MSLVPQWYEHPSQEGNRYKHVNFRHPHVVSLFKEGLWGFPDDKQGIKSKALDGDGNRHPVLLHGNYDGLKAVFSKATLISNAESHELVKYWVKNPKGSFQSQIS